MNLRSIGAAVLASACGLGVAAQAGARDDWRDRDDDDRIGGVEIKGAVGAVDAAARTFELGGWLITVTDATLIDASIVESARGVELGREDLAFGALPEALDQLLSPGDRIEARVDAGGLALQIEDDD